MKPTLSFDVQSIMLRDKLYGMEVESLLRINVSFEYELLQHQKANIHVIVKKSLEGPSNLTLMTGDILGSWRQAILFSECEMSLWRPNLWSAHADSNSEVFEYMFNWFPRAAFVSDMAQQRWGIWGVGRVIGWQTNCRNNPCFMAARVNQHHNNLSGSLAMLEYVSQLLRDKVSSYTCLIWSFILVIGKRAWFNCWSKCCHLHNLNHAPALSLSFSFYCPCSSKQHFIQSPDFEIRLDWYPGSWHLICVNMSPCFWMDLILGV